MVKSAEDRAAAALSRVERRRPYVVRLAMLASLAVRADTHLLRRLRTELLPDADVSAEPDLWFSPLVESRGVHGFVLDGAVTTLLRVKLAEDPPLLTRAIAITADAHRDAPPTIRLEEAVNGIALVGGEDAAARIDAALRPAVLAMVRDAEHGLDIARWALRALPRFQPAVRATESAILLAVGAAARLGRGGIVERLDTMATTTPDHRWVLPASTLADRANIGVELLGDGIRFLDPASGGHPLPLPQTEPLLVHVLWDDDGREVQRTIDVASGRVVRVGRAIDVVRIRTFAGDEFRLEARRTPLVSASLVEVALLGAAGEFVTGVIVAADRIIAPAAPFRHASFVDVRRGTSSFQARVLNREPAEPARQGAAAALVGDDVVVLEPIDVPYAPGPLEPVLPLDTGALEARWHGASGSGSMDVRPPVTAVVLGKEQPFAGDATIARWDRTNDELLVLSPMRLPLGGMVVSEGRLLGIVTREPGGQASDATPVAVGARTIRRVLERFATADRGADAVVEVRLPGEENEPIAGFIVGPDRIVTAANRLGGVAEVEVRQGGHSFRARVLREVNGQAAQKKQVPDRSPASLRRNTPEDDVLVLVPVDTGPFGPALELREQLSSRRADRPNEQLMPSRADVLSIEDGRVVRSVAALPVMHDRPALMTLSIEFSGDDEPPRPRRGSPVMLDGEVIGMVVRVNSLFGRHDIEAVGAAAIRKALERGAVAGLEPLGWRFARVPVFGSVGAGKSEVIQVLADEPYRPRGARVREVVRVRRSTAPLLTADAFVIESSESDPAVVALHMEGAAAAIIVAEANGEFAVAVRRWLTPVRAASATAPVFLVATKVDVHRHEADEVRRQIEGLTTEFPATRGILVETNTNAGFGELLRSLADDIDWSQRRGGDEAWFERQRDLLERVVLAETRPVIRLDELMAALRSAGSDDALLPDAGVRVSDTANVAFLDPEAFERLAITFLHEGGRRGDMIVPWARRAEASGKDLDRVLDEHDVDHDLREATRQALLEELERIGAIVRVPLPRDEIVVFVSLFRARSNRPPEIRRPVPLLTARAPTTLWPTALAAAARLEALRQGRLRDSFVDPDRPLRSLGLAGKERTTRFWIESRDRTATSSLQLLGSEEAGEAFARRAFRDTFEESLRAVAPPDTVIERAGEGGPGEAPPAA